MNVNGGKRLWHDARLSKLESVRQRERDACGVWHGLNAPTGHRPPAQGWRVNAYLGFTFRIGNNLNEVAAIGARTVKMEWTQPRCGWEFFADDDPG